jgi:GlcNAc-P-P-Und epimerase
LSYWLGLIIGRITYLVAQISGKNLPVSSIRGKKFASSTEFRSAKGNLGQFIRPFSLSGGVQRILFGEFIDPELNREFFIQNNAEYIIRNNSILE